MVVINVCGILEKGGYKWVVVVKEFKEVGVGGYGFEDCLLFMVVGVDEFWSDDFVGDVDDFGLGRDVDWCWIIYVSDVVIFDENWVFLENV